MQVRRLVLLFALLAATAPAARAQDALKPLRSLTYQVAYSFVSAQDTHVDGGLTGGGQTDKAREQEYGRGSVQRGIRSEDRGMLSIDVVAATADGGLVVDTSYEGKESKQPPIRVAVYQDGQLAYDPKQLLSTQALHVLPMLARGVVAGQDVSPGSSWSRPFAAPATGKTTFSVTHRENDKATLTILSDLTLGGVNGFEEHDDGSATYAIDRLCPLAFDLRFRIRRASGGPGDVQSTDGRVVATLVSDTFAKR